MNIIKKISKAFLISAAFAVAMGAFAIPKGPCETKPVVCCEEPAPGPFAFTYAKDLGLSCPRDFYFNAAFLLMQAREDGLEYAVLQSRTDTNPAVLPLRSGEIQSLIMNDQSVDWNFGARINIGFYLDHDAWDIGASWTYFRINNDEGIELNNGMLIPLWLDPGVVPQATAQRSSARWTGDLHAIDLRLGKPFHISRLTIFNPFFGARFAWIGEDFMARNAGPFKIDNTGDDINEVDMKADHDFWGIGARAGIDTEWHVGSGVYLFGNISTSFLYSHFDVEQSVIIDSEARSQIENDFNTVTQNAEIALGLSWNKYLCKNKYLLNLKIAYEFHAWFDHNRLRRFLDEDNIASNMEVGKGNLYLSGFSFNIGFDF